MRLLKNSNNFLKCTINLKNNLMSKIVSAIILIKSLVTAGNKAESSAWLKEGNKQVIPTAHKIKLFWL